MEWYEKYVQKVGVAVNAEAAPFILEGLEHNKQVHGYRFCPCSAVRTPDTIRPCKVMRETKNCHCGLFETEAQ